MMHGCNQLLQKVYETGFMMDDVLLYLDTHPHDVQAMEYYQEARKANKEAIAAYEQACGPLMINGVCSDSWSWINNPWPWEGGR